MTKKTVQGNHEDGLGEQRALFNEINDNGAIAKEMAEHEIPVAVDKPSREAPDGYSPVAEETEFKELTDPDGLRGEMSMEHEQNTNIQKQASKPRRKKAMTAGEMRARIQELEAKLERKSVKNWIRNESSKFDEHMDKLNENLHLDLHGNLSDGDNRKIATCLIGAAFAFILLLMAFVNCDTCDTTSYSAPQVTRIKLQDKSDKYEQQFAKNIFAPVKTKELAVPAQPLKQNTPSQYCKDAQCPSKAPQAGDMIQELKSLDKPFDPRNNVFRPQAGRVRGNGFDLQLPPELNDVAPVKGPDGSWTWQKNDGRNSMRFTVDASGNNFSFSRECHVCASQQGQPDIDDRTYPANAMNGYYPADNEKAMPASSSEESALEMSYARYSSLPVEYRLSLLAEHFNSNCRVIEYTLRSAAERSGAKTDADRINAIKKILMTPDGVRTRQLYEIWDKTKDNKQVLSAIDTLIIDNGFYGQPYNNAVETALMLLYQAQ